MRDPTTNSFNTHSTPGNGQVTDYQKVKLPMPRSGNLARETYEAFDEPKMPPSSSLNGTFGNPRGLPPRTVAIFSFHDIILAST